MKTYHSLLSRIFFVFASAICICYGQNNSPSVAWRKIDWAHYNVLGEYVHKDESGEDWWYTAKPVFDAGNNLIGYVAVGYTSNQVTHDFETVYNAAINYDGDCDANQYLTGNVDAGDCVDRMVKDQYRRGKTRGNLAFLDVYGKMKWCYVYNEYEIEEVIPVSDGFVAIGTTYSVKSPKDFTLHKYNPYLGSNTTFTNADCTSPGGSEHLNVLKVDFNGDVVWNNLYSMENTSDFTDMNLLYNKSNGYGWDIILNSANKLVALGASFQVSTGTRNVFVVEIDPSTGEITDIVNRKKTISFSNLNSYFYPPNGSVGVTIAEIGNSLNYVIGGKIYYDGNFGMPGPTDDLYNDVHRPFLLRVDQNFDPSGWAVNPLVLVNNADFNKNGQVTDMVWDNPGGNDKIVVPFIQSCAQCNAGQGGNIGTLRSIIVDATSGTIDNGISYGTVQAFDLRAGITKTSDGNYAIVSSKKDFTVSDYGNATWDAVIDESHMTLCRGSLLDPGVINYWDTDAYVAKFTGSGSILWETQFDAAENYRERESFPGDIKRQECLYKIFETPDKGLVICGNTSHNFDDYYLAKLFSDCQSNYNYTVSQPDNIIEIVGNIPWSSSRSVKGIVRIFPGSTLTISGASTVIEFADVARTGIQTKIEVMAGGKLVIENGAILTSLQGCDQAMWQGIEVEGQPTLGQNPSSNQGWVVVTGNSQVNRAYNAVSTTARDDNGNVEWSKTGGGIVQITNSSFTDNSRSFEFMSYTNMVSGNPANDRSYILQSSFSTTASFGNLGNIRDPYSFISMWHTRNIRIEGNTFTNNRLNVKAEDWGSGIISIDAGYKVVPRCTTLTFPCTGSVPNTFNNLFQGIYVAEGVSDANVTVDRDVFNNNIYGVRLANVRMPKIINNTFNLSDVGAPVYPTVFGIFSDAAYNVRVENNTINGLGPLGTNNRTIGTACINSDAGTGGFWDYRNTYNTLETGSQIQESNVTVGGYIVDCNFYNGDNTFTTSGIFVADGSVANQGVPCGFGTQVSLQANEFTGTCNGTDRFQIYSNPGVSPWSYRSLSSGSTGFNTGCLQSIPPPNGTPNGTACFLDKTASACPSQYSGSPVSSHIIARGNYVTGINEIAVMKGQIDGGNTQATLEYVNGDHSAGQIRDYLIDRSPYLSDEVLVAAIDKDLPPGHIKQILIANSSLTDEVIDKVDDADLPTGVYNDIIAAQNGQGARMDLEDRIKQQEDLVNIAVGEITYYYLDTNEVDSAILFLESVNTPFALCALVSIVGNNDKIKTNQYLSDIADAALDFLNNPKTQEEGENLIEFVNFYRIMLKVLESEEGYFALDDEALDELEEIAESDNIMASWANAIVEFVRQESNYKDVINYDFNTPKNLSTVQSDEIPNSSSKIAMTVYPNPAMEGFSIQLSRMIEENENASICVTDLNGRMMLITSWSAGQDYGWVDTQNWSNGMYIVQVLINNNELLYKKIIVAK